MLLLKLFIVSALIVSGAVSIEAADMEMQMVDKNCWVEVYDDTRYDAKNPHAKLQGPKEYASLKDVDGKNWSNEIESIIVGPGATVRAFKERDFQGPEIVFMSDQRVPKLSKLGMSNDIESMKILCEKSDLSGSMGDQNNRIGVQPSDAPGVPPSSTSTTTTTTTTTPAP